jgi:hypothetical protein
VNLFIDLRLMKPLLATVLAVLSLGNAIVQAQEENLTNWAAQIGRNVQVGQLLCPLQVQGLSIRDASGNLTASVPLLTDPASVGATTTIGDTLYAVIPPDNNNNVTVVVMYDADPTVDPSTSDEIVNATQDVLNHNGWSNSSYLIRNINQGGELLPQGTQFWICSSTGYLTLTDSTGVICLAGLPPPTVAPTDPALAVFANTPQ